MLASDTLFIRSVISVQSFVKSISASKIGLLALVHERSFLMSPLEFQASFGIYIPVRTLNTYPRAMEILNRISYKPLLSLLGLVANSFLIVAIISKV